MHSILTFPSSLLVVIAVIQTFTININAFSPPPLPIVLSPPILGLGALFRPRNIKFVKSSDVQTVGGGKEGGEEALVGAGKFFVDAFWYVVYCFTCALFRGHLSSFFAELI